VLGPMKVKIGALLWKSLIEGLKLVFPVPEKREGNSSLEFLRSSGSAVQWEKGNSTTERSSYIKACEEHRAFSHSVPGYSVTLTHTTPCAFFPHPVAPSFCFPSAPAVLLSNPNQYAPLSLHPTFLERERERESESTGTKAKSLAN